jgi:phosphoribosyl 1,2-cyclic phosphate phosphodiesterase
MGELTMTFLGTGTSQGVPMIGCDCAVCLSEDPRDKRSRASLYIESSECAWVIDTGPDFRGQCLRENVRRVDAVVYTHSHSDHMMGFDDLRSFCPRDGKLPVYASRETMDDLQRAFQFAFNGKNHVPGYLRPDPRTISGAFQLGETEITPFTVPHGRAHVFGYLLSRNGERLVAYFSDCKTIPEGCWDQIAGVRHLIVDALRHQAHPTHMNVGEALEIIGKIQPGRAWFTHLCHDLGHAETQSQLPEGVQIAYDGLKIQI